MLHRRKEFYKQKEHKYNRVRYFLRFSSKNSYTDSISRSANEQNSSRCWLFTTSLGSIFASLILRDATEGGGMPYGFVVVSCSDFVCRNLMSCFCPLCELGVHRSCQCLELNAVGKKNTCAVEIRCKNNVTNHILYKIFRNQSRRLNYP